jgi:hypothetical protein
MTINSATDHGYNINWSIKVQPGLHVRDADRNYMKVVRRHADGVWWDCEWLEGPHTGKTIARHHDDILEDAYAP